MKTCEKGEESIFSVPLHIARTDIRRIAIGNCQGQGGRPYQEDSFGFSDISPQAVASNGFTAVLADGMGGLSQSELVSKALVNFYTKNIFTYTENPSMRQQMYESVVQSNIALRNGKGGSTLVVVHCCSHGIYWCSVGDSRLYLCRNGRLFLMTEDMDYRRDLFTDVLAGKLSVQNVLSNPKKDALVQYVGMAKEVFPESSDRPYLPYVGDKLLLCSDGIYNALSEEELLCALEQPAGACAEMLGNMVVYKNYKNQDNYTALVLEFLN